MFQTFGNVVSHLTVSGRTLDCWLIMITPLDNPETYTLIKNPFVFVSVVPDL